ncbi:MAG: outer membrane protein assembly factor BamD [Deltaproteobacteria bacterium]|nr:MAG: outer membrane protein assembly factor BamD [Deltaproteobacteria bacterium]
MKHTSHVASLLLCIIFGCAHNKPIAGDPNSAAGLYVRGVEALYAELYPEASRDLTELKTKHPYSRYAALAELRLGDLQARQGHAIEAIEVYRTFLRFHPNHEQAQYAALQIAEGHFAQVPSEWWFLPPAAEKDQASTRAAIAAYDDLLNRWPQASAAPLARQHLDACRRKLADHEMYVAHFYLHHGAYPAAAARAETVLSQFEGLGLDAAALWVAGQARLRDGDTAQAQRHLEALVERFADSPQGTAARPMLESLSVSLSAQQQNPA